MGVGTLVGIGAMAGCIAVSGVLGAELLHDLVDKQLDRVEADARNQVIVKGAVDGETIVLTSGARVRLIGIDAPALDECGGWRARAQLRHLVQGRSVILRNPPSVPDRDRAGRQLRYVELRHRDPAISLLGRALVRAHGDPRDGDHDHPREQRYEAAEAPSVRYTCP